MRTLGALSLCLLLMAGCTTNAGSSPTDAAETTTEPTTAATTAPTTTTSQPPSSSAAQPSSSSQPPTSTTEPPATTEPTPPPAARGVLYHESFDGTLPDPAAGPPGTNPSFTFVVPAGGDRLTFFYNTTYTGMWGSLVSLTDQVDTRVLYGLDNCPATDLNPEVMQDYQCAYEQLGPIGAGDWVANLSWQVGGTVEEYTLELTVYGPLPA